MPKIEKMTISFSVNRTEDYQGVRPEAGFEVILLPGEDPGKALADAYKWLTEKTIAAAETGLQTILAALPPEQRGAGARDKQAKGQAAGPPPDANADVCKQCGAEVFVKNLDGKWERWDADGQLHFKTCSARNHRRSEGGGGYGGGRGGGGYGRGQGGGNNYGRY